MDGMLGFWIFGAILFVIIIVMPIRSAFNRRRDVQDTEKLRGKNEALFHSMFPELQPHFHPERLVEFAQGRLGRSWSAKARWANPAGFPGAAVAELKAEERDRERVRLLDTAGMLLHEFTFEKHPEGGVLRLGKGKITVDIRKPAQPRVRYWHPEREFKWSRAGWIFKTPVADEAFESSSNSSSLSSSSSDSSRTAAAAAGIVGLGGTFDGAGAAAGWDDSPQTASSSGSSGAESISNAVGVSSGVSLSDSSSDSTSDSTGDSGSTAY